MTPKAVTIELEKGILKEGKNTITFSLLILSEEIK
jgi:hypothetical protein